jgi:hypothetical protein
MGSEEFIALLLPRPPHSRIFSVGADGLVHLVNAAAVIQQIEHGFPYS